ncbi:MAG: neuromedin U, partial [Xanthomarina sp.]
MKKHLLIAFGLLLLTTLHAQENRTSADPEDGQSLNDKVQNPIANMVSIPLNYNLSLKDEYTHILNIQPIIPL